MNPRGRAQRELRWARRAERRARRWGRRAAADAADRLRGRRDPRVPPRRLGLPSFLPDVLDRTAEVAIVGVAGLAPGERMLDIGCGPGQMALRVAPHLGAGRYEGFDVSGRTIAWARGRVSPTDPRLHFTRVDAGNDLYNPDGAGDAGELRFPYPDAYFDLAFAGSLFTHLKPRESAHYLNEARRILRPGGRIASTWFLLNDESERLLAAGAARYSELEGGAPLRLDHELVDDDGLRFRTSHPRLPEQRIAVAEDDVLEFHRAAGLEVADVHHGHWCGRERRSGRLGQDLILARAAPARG
jgi:SAM-dependent methyltransferase